METVLKWNDVDTLMPIRNKVVLVETPYCRWDFCCGFTNGYDWIDADEKTKIGNVKIWAYVQTPAKAHSDGLEV